MAHGTGWSPRVTLSPAEIAYLQSLPPLRIGVAPQWAPIAFIDSQGRIDGISADYLDFLRNALHLRFSFVPTRSWAETIRLANAGRIDFVVAASGYDGLTPGFRLSTPFVRYPLVIVTRETAPFIGGLDDIDGAEVAMIGDAQMGSARFSPLRHLHVVAVASAEDGLKAVAKGRAFAYIGNLGVVDRIVRERYPGTLRVAAPADRAQELSFGVAPDLAPLLPLIDRVLASIPEAEREHIQNSWLSTRFTFGVAPRTLWLVLAPVGALTFVFLAVLWFNMVRLRKEVCHRRRTERELLFETRFKTLLMNTVPSVVFQLRLVRARRPRFDLVFVNRRIDAFMPSHETDVTAVFGSFVRVLDRAQRRRLARLFLRSARSRERVRAEFMLESRLHGQAWFHVEADPQAREDGSVEWSGYLHDLNEAKAAQAALIAAKLEAEDAARARDAFIATVSHEIRTPMSGIVGILQLLDHDGLTADDRHLVEMAGNAAELSLRILNDILDFAKSENGGLPLQFAPMSVAEIVMRSAGLIAPEVERKGLQLHVDVAPDVAPCHIGDVQRLGQVLLNLLGNAVKFTERGAVSIRVAATSETAARQTLSVRIADTGIGISREDQARLFSPFSQAGGTLAARRGGTGLGLAICKRLIEQMDGTITLESELGRGTTITRTLDLLVDRASRPAAGEAGVQSAPRAKASAVCASPRVLLVDDQVINLEVLRRQLARLNVDGCDLAEDGARALSAHEQNEYAMVITDCVMPVLDGVALIAAIRRREQSTGKHTILIALTADASPQRRGACFDAGADEVFVKPLSPEQLRALLASYGIRTAPTGGNGDAESGHPLGQPLRQALLADMEALRAFWLSEDREQARRMAHTIAGTAAWFQLRKLAEIAMRLERELDEQQAWPHASMRALEVALEHTLASEAFGVQ